MDNLTVIVVLRSVMTVLFFLCFLGIAFWAYSGVANKGFDEAAQLPFTESDDQVSH